MKQKVFYMQAYTIKSDEPISDVPCHSVQCTECCERLSPHLTEEEFLSGKYVYSLYDGGDPEMPAIAIPRTERGCVYLSDNKVCTIYEDRPLSCRQFDCRKGHHPKINNKFGSTLDLL